MKIAIVGARESKWTKEQIPKVKSAIRVILDIAVNRNGIIEPVKGSYRWTAAGFYSWMKIRPIEQQEITMVSGHCPLGEELWYCVTCQTWLNVSDRIASAHFAIHSTDREPHIGVKVYNKGGVDTWSEIIATELGIKQEIYPAPARQWNDKIIHKGVFTPKHLQKRGMFIVGVAPIKKLGYRSRNIQMAEAGLKKLFPRPKGWAEATANRLLSDPYVLYDIEPAGSCRCKGKRTYEKILGHNFDTQIREYTCSKCEGDSAYSGGTWTLKYARKLGREVYKIVIK